MRILLASGAAALALAAGSIVPGMPLGAAPQQAQAADNGKTTLTVAVAQSVDSLSPFLAQRLMSTSVHRLMYDFLTNYDPKDNHAIPGLATKWEPSADKLTWTYTIRSDSKWSDGQQATAEDAAWTFNKMMTDEAAAQANGNFVANFKKVTAPSPTQLVIELKEPQATMAALDVPIVPKHVWEKVGLLQVQQRQGVSDRRQRAVRRDRPQGRPVREAQGQQGLLARQAEVRRAGLQDVQGPGRRGRRPAQG